MFGFGRKQDDVITPARIFALTLFPDNQVIEEDWFEADAGGMARPEDGKIDGSFRIGEVDCRIDATLRNGNAIFSTWAAGKIVTSSLFLSSDDLEMNAHLLGLYLDSVRATDLVRQLTEGQEDVFGAVAKAPERPLLATMLMPAPSIEVTDGLRDLQRAWVSAIVGAE